VQAKAKIMVVRDVERDDIEYISKTLGCAPVSHPDHMKPEKLGSADLVQEVHVGGGRMVKVTGIEKGATNATACVLLRGSNKLVLAEAERSLHDALCVIRCLVQQPSLVPGGAAPEMEVVHHLSKWALTLDGAQLLLTWLQLHPEFQSPTCCCARDGRCAPPDVDANASQCAVYLSFVYQRDSQRADVRLPVNDVMCCGSFRSCLAARTTATPALLHVTCCCGTCTHRRE
jgi:TCP-1/cpn60 chaperonin family